MVNTENYLSVIIVNWNSVGYLKSCLNSVYQTCDIASTQIIVVDGASYDGCQKMLETNYPDVEFIQSKRNIGFGRCNNLGFRKAVGDTILLLNPDTELQAGAVNALLEALRSSHKAAIVGAQLINSDGSHQDNSIHPLTTAWNAATANRWQRARWWRRQIRLSTNLPKLVPAVSGACMMMHASTFRHLNGFDPRFFMYSEDIDLCFRAHKFGYPVKFVPIAKVIHHGGACSSSAGSHFSNVMMREATRVYLEKNHGHGEAFLFRIYMTLSAIFRIFLLAAYLPPVRKSFVNGQDPAALIRKWWQTLAWCLCLSDKAIIKLHDNSGTLAQGISPKQATSHQ